MACEHPRFEFEEFGNIHEETRLKTAHIYSVHPPQSGLAVEGRGACLVAASRAKPRGSLRQHRGHTMVRMIIFWSMRQNQCWFESPEILDQGQPPGARVSESAVRVGHHE